MRFSKAGAPALLLAALTALVVLGNSCRDRVNQHPAVSAGGATSQSSQGVATSDDSELSPASHRVDPPKATPLAVRAHLLNLQNRIVEDNETHQKRLVGTWEVTADRTASPPRPADLAGGGALELAARYYMLATEDFKPTVGKLIKAGWLPFAIYDQSDLAYTPTSDPPLRGMEDWQLEQIGTAYWTIDAKQSVLDAWYAGYYGESQSPTLIQPDRLTLNPGFWVQPNTSIPMKIGPGEGEISLVSLEDEMESSWATVHFGPGTAAWKFRNLRVPVIHTH